MKALGAVILTIGLVLMGWQIFGGISAKNEYKNEISNYWSLADKSSTIEAKSDYINKFVQALENSKLSGNNALIYKNPDNSFDMNLQALKTLQGRLEQIKTMNPSSFEYQQAIQQITAQEQGEAQDMLDVFNGVWYLNHHFFLWEWVGGTILILGFLVALIGGAIIGGETI